MDAAFAGRCAIRMLFHFQHAEAYKKRQVCGDRAGEVQQRMKAEEGSGKIRATGFTMPVTDALSSFLLSPSNYPSGGVLTAEPKCIHVVNVFDKYYYRTH